MHCLPMHLVPDMFVSAYHQYILKTSVMHSRCTFGDVPPRVDAVKIYKNVGPDDQVDSSLHPVLQHLAMLLGRTVMHSSN